MDHRRPSQSISHWHRGLIPERPTPPPPTHTKTGTCQWFETMEAGLHFCEEQFLDVAIESGLCSPRRSDVTLAEALLAHRSLSDAQAEPGGPARFEAAAALLGRYVRQRKLRCAARVLDGAGGRGGAAAVEGMACMVVAGYQADTVQPSGGC